MKVLDSPRTLRISMILVLFYSLLQLVYLIFSFVTSYLNLTQSTLLPEALVDYVAFPLYFLVPFFLTIFIAAARAILTNRYHKTVVFLLVVVSLLYFLFGSRLYSFIMYHNPYGS